MASGSMPKGGGDRGVVVSITAFGRDSNRIGFGDDVAAAAGLVALDDAGDPVFCGDAIADPLTGLTAVVWRSPNPLRYWIFRWPISSVPR